MLLVALLMLLLVVGGAFLMLRSSVAPSSGDLAPEVSATQRQPASTDPELPQRDWVETLQSLESLRSVETVVRATLDRPLSRRAVRGRVLDLEDSALSGAEVQLLRPRRADLLHGRELAPVGTPVTTEADGSFHLIADEVAEGPVALVVSHPAHASLLQEKLWLPSAANLEVGVLRMQPALVLLGVVLDAHEQPIESAVVVVHPGSSDQPEYTEPLVTTTDAQGKFMLDRIPYSFVRVEAEAPGHARALEDMVPVQVAPEEADRLTIHLGEPEELGGRVVGARGEPLSGARVQVRRVGPVVTSGGATRSGKDGSFAFADLEQGYYTVLVDHAGFARFQLPRAHTGVRNLELSLTPLGQAEMMLANVPLDRTFEVEVLVLRAPSEGTFFAEGSAQRWPVVEGRLCVEGLSEGTLCLEIRAPGAAPLRTMSFTARAGQTRDLGRFSVQRGATLMGRVVAASGEPRQARVALAPRHLTNLAQRRSAFDLTDRRETVTDANGRFVFEGVASGPRCLSVQRQGGATQTLPLVMVTGASEIDLGKIVLAGVGCLQGRVLDKAGKPRAGVVVVVRTPAGSHLQIRSDAKGHYRFEDLLAGRYVVRAVVAETPGEVIDVGQVLANSGPRGTVLDLASGETIARDLRLE